MVCNAWGVKMQCVHVCVIFSEYFKPSVNSSILYERLVGIFVLINIQSF